MAQGIANTTPESLEEPDKGPALTTEIFEGDHIYDGIKADFANAELYVKKIERVRNHELWRRFTHERDGFFQEQQEKDPHFDLNEKYLYHGTNGNKEVFCKEEIDNRLSRRGCFGNGNYFSDNPKKCAKYAERGQSEPFILLYRVLLGESKVYPKGEQDKNLKREPEKPGGGSKRFYDSVQGCPTNFQEFVIYERRRALIECIISFSRNKDDPTEEADVLHQTAPSGAGDTILTHSSSSTSVNLNKGYGDAPQEAQHEVGDSDSCSSDEEDERKEKKKRTANEESDTSDDEIESQDQQVIGPLEEEDVSDAESGDGKDDISDAESVDEKDDISDAESVDEKDAKEVTSDEEFHEILPLKFQYDEIEVQTKAKQFMAETNEDEEHLAKFFVIMEGLDVEAAVFQYNNFSEVELEPEDKAEAEKIVANLESELNPSNRDYVGLDALDVDDENRIVIMQELVDQFCEVVGLEKNVTEHDTMARNYLLNCAWQTDVAIIAYYEETHGIDV